jgi:hypothetical protein
MQIYNEYRIKEEKVNQMRLSLSSNNVVVLAYKAVNWMDLRKGDSACRLGGDNSPQLPAASAPGHQTSSASQNTTSGAFKVSHIVFQGM